MFLALIMCAFQSGSERSWIGYSEMGVPIVAGRFCEHREVSAMWEAFSISSSMSALMDHAEHRLPSRNTVWDRISM
jgi:hypothetical protein